MTAENYELVQDDFKDTADVPRGHAIFYRCTGCGTTLPSLPEDNCGCSCGNIFIDQDYGRLVVADLARIVALRKLD